MSRGETIRLTPDTPDLVEAIARWHDETHDSPRSVCLDQPCISIWPGRSTPAVYAAVQDFHDDHHADGWTVCLNQPCALVKELAHAGITAGVRK